MACVAAALGLMPLGGASAPAVSAARMRIAEETGAMAVSVAANLSSRRPQAILSKESFLNAITVLQAIGGSTNAVVHLMAIINRHPDVAGQLTLQTFDEVGRKTPLLVDLKPSGDNYMNDFHNAGGMFALLHTLRPLLHLEAKTITGKTLGETLDATPFKTFPYSRELIRSLEAPLYPHSALVVLYGNLAPNGAVMKASASKDRRLVEFSGPAVVFENTVDLAKRIDSEELQVTKDSVLVLKGIGKKNQALGRRRKKVFVTMISFPSTDHTPYRSHRSSRYARSRSHPHPSQTQRYLRHVATLRWANEWHSRWNNCSPHLARIRPDRFSIGNRARGRYHSIKSGEEITRDGCKRSCHCGENRGETKDVVGGYCWWW